MAHSRFPLPSPSSVAIVLTVVVALCFQAWVLHESHDRALRIYGTRAANRAQATGHQVQAVFKQLDLLLLNVREHLDADEIARGPSLETSRKVESMRRLLQAEAAKVPQIGLLHVISPEGKYVYSSNLVLPSISIADRSYFQEQRQASQDELRISAPLFGRVSHRWSIFPSRRLTTRDGRFAGIVFAAIDTEALGSVMVAVDQQEWVLSLYDRERRLVSRSPLANNAIGAVASDPRLASPDHTQSFKGPGLGEQTSHIWATSPVPGLPLFTCTGFAEEKALVQWKQDLKINLIVSALLVVGCITVILLHHRNQQSADSIRAMHQRMKLAATSIHMGIWEWEPEADHLSWDEDMLALFGIPRSEFQGHQADWLSRIHEEDRAEVQSAQASSLQGRPFDIRFRVLGGPRPRYLRATAIRLQEEKPRLLGIAWDITEEESAQRRIQISETYFRTLFNTVPDAVAVIQEGKVVDTNQAYHELFQIKEGQDAPPWELAPILQQNGLRSREHGQQLAELALAGRVQRTSWQYQRRDGTHFQGDLALSLFRHQGQKLLIAIIRDQTEIRVMEEKLHQAQKLDALGQLAGGVAHDFNNMLAAILSSSELLKDKLQDEKLQLLARTIHAAAERASQLTRKLLAFARKGKILSTPTDVHQLLHEAVALLERTIDRRITIETQLGADQATVVGDPSQIQNALLNLGVNARDSMPEGGNITYRTEIVDLSGNQCHRGTFNLEAGPYLHVAISDNGCGIPEANLQKIFDPFFTTKEVDKGTGLGLASVFGTMVSHRGAVTVDSQVGHGSTFHLYLPLTATDLPTKHPKNAPEPPRGHGRVLIIDDEDFVRTATTLLLEALGYQGLSASDGEEGLAYFEQHHSEVSAVLLDMVMPKLSGTEVAIRLQAIDPKVPIILASGFPKNAEITKLLNEGIAGFIQKPFNRQDLAELLAKVISAKSS